MSKAIFNAVHAIVNNRCNTAKASKSPSMQDELRNAVNEKRFTMRSAEWLDKYFVEQGVSFQDFKDRLAQDNEKSDTYLQPKAMIKGFNLIKAFAYNDSIYIDQYTDVMMVNAMRCKGKLNNHVALCSISREIILDSVDTKGINIMRLDQGATTAGTQTSSTRRALMFLGSISYFERSKDKKSAANYLIVNDNYTGNLLHDMYATTTKTVETE